jgi:hypothetical protein
MSPIVRQALERLIDTAASSVEPVSTREAAIATGALPVYCDLGGFLAITAGGKVLHYDPERKLVSAVVDETWRRAALVHAVRKHPELSELFPRPNTAVVCPQCGGSGLLMGKADCGWCMGAGWA